MSNFPTQPFFSVVTVTFNAAETIEYTLGSILKQNKTLFELIVIDGGSTDNTLEILNHAKEEIDVFISEPDKGIYDAMNKGINNASGEYVVFMNSGDCFFNEATLDDVYKKLTALDSKPDVIYGRHAVLTKTGTKAGLEPSFSTRPKHMPFCHQSVYARRELLEMFHFNLSYKIAADYDFILNCIRNESVFYDCNISLSIVSPGGLSDSCRIKVIKQYSDIYIKHFNPTISVKIYWLFSIGKEILKMPIKRMLRFI